MRAGIWLLIGVVVVVLAWGVFLYNNQKRYQGVVDAEQVRLEGQISKLLAVIPGYIAGYAKYYQTAVDSAWAKDLERAANDCAAVVKAVSATKEITTAEVERVNESLARIYAAYQGTRDQVHLRKELKPAASKDQAFIDIDNKMFSGFTALTRQIDIVSGMQESEFGFSKNIVARIFGFPRWRKLYDNRSQK